MPRKIVPLAQVSRCIVKIGIIFFLFVPFTPLIETQGKNRHSCFKNFHGSVIENKNEEKNLFP